MHFSYKDRAAFSQGPKFYNRSAEDNRDSRKIRKWKTTIVNLLLKLIKLSQGEILVDGISLNEYTSESWLRQISFVSQEPFLFHADIKDILLLAIRNILRGDR